MFAEVIRAHRRRLGVTQEELAVRTGLSVRSIGKLEAGRTARPRAATIRLLADAFGVAAEALSGPSADAGAPQRPRQLPAPPQPFTGRVDELATLDRLDGGSTVTVAAVDGMAGVGKTALAVQWAHRIVDQYPDGQLFLDLQGSTAGMAPVEPAEALERLLRTMGVYSGQIPDRAGDRAGLWRSVLAGRRVLLVLDGAATPAQVRPLLPGSPGCLVVVTSRHRLVGLDPTGGVSLDTLPAADAVGLFAALAGRDRLDPGLDGLTAEIVSLCGRLPLAIRIAAGRLRAHPSWGLADLAERLRDHRERLAELDDGTRSVTAALDLSYRQLSADQQRVYRLLGLHPGPDIDSYAVAALAGLPVGAARRRLDRLLDAHLLQEPVPGRFGLHDLIRAHAGAAARAEAEPTRAAAVGRLRDYFRHTAAVAMAAAYPYRRGRRYQVPPADTPAPDLSDPTRAIAWLDAEQRNLLATAVRATAQGSPEHAQHLAAILAEHLHTRGRYGDLEVLFGHALTAARATGDADGESAALNALGWIDWLRGRYESGRGWFAQALQLSRTVGHRDDEANALIGLAWGQLRQGQHEAAAGGFRSALEISHGTGHRGREQEAVNGLGWVHWLQGRYRPAVEEFSRAGEISRAAGHRGGELDALLALGNCHRMLGRYESALDHFGRALDMARTSGHRYGQMHARLGVGNCHRMLGRYESALDHFGRALEIARATGQREGEMDALSGLGHVLRRQGRYGAAADHYRRALDLARTHDSRHWQLEARHGLGRLCHATGQPAAAADHHQQALTLATDLRQPPDQARVHDGLAHAHQLLGEPESAGRHWERALEILTDLDLDHTADEEVTTASIRDHLGRLIQVVPPHGDCRAAGRTTGGSGSRR